MRKLIASLVVSMFPAIAQAQDVRLRFPVACAIGQTCFIQHYVDVDPGPDARDYACGTLTYDGHDGVDIRLPTVAAQQGGVDVLAAADGTVLRVRDGMPDVSVRSAAGPAAVKGSECGNGIVLRHAAGMETQYCHLRKGSVRVSPGEAVREGQPLGQIGLSGLSEFPHLHFTVRHLGRAIDPFGSGSSGMCGRGAGLWLPAVEAALTYRPSEVINSGFAEEPVTMESIEAGTVASPTSRSSAVVAYVRAIGVQAGDEQNLALFDPSGRKLAENTVGPMDRNKAQWMMFTGARKPASGWLSGGYKARYVLRRAGRTIIDQEFRQTVTP